MFFFRAIKIYIWHYWEMYFGERCLVRYEDDDLSFRDALKRARQK